MRNPDGAPVAVGDVTRVQDLVALRRPAAAAEVEISPVGSDLLQPAAVELDRVDLIARVVRARHHEPPAVRRVAARAVVAVWIRRDALEAATVGRPNRVD